MPRITPTPHCLRDLAACAYPNLDYILSNGGLSALEHICEHDPSSVISKEALPRLLEKRSGIRALIILGVIPLEMLAQAIYLNHCTTLNRLNDFLTDKSLQLFHDPWHYHCWHTWTSRLYRMTDREKAALYLLTASDSLWQKSVPHVDKRGIDFRHIVLGSVTEDQYALFQAAQALAAGRRNITVYDLASEEAVSDQAFHLITNALLLAGFKDVIL